MGHCKVDITVKERDSQMMYVDGALTYSDQVVISSNKIISEGDRSVLKIDRFAHYRTLTISSLLAAVLWCTACSFYSTAISHCTSVGIKWEKGGVSPSELIRQQTYARQDGAGNQPEVTLWQIYPEQEINGFR